MRVSRRVCLLGAMIMALSFFRSGRLVAGDPAPALERPNRARWSLVTASGSRTARLDEIPRVRGVKGNISLAYPSVWPLRVPRYAIDSSPLTFWASEEEGESHWIQLDLRSPLRTQVRVSAIAISWEQEYGQDYKILASKDGESWEPVHSREDGQGGIEVVRFDPSLSMSGFRIEVSKSKGASAAIIDVGVYGVDEPEPSPISGLEASPGPGNAVTLSWKQESDGSTYFYRIYRAAGKEPALIPENLAETTGERLFIDRGLAPDRTYHYQVVAETFGGRTGAAAACRATTRPGPVFRRLKYMGVVEGFYNDPWPHQERLRMISFLEDVGMNYYIYAPKVEPFHRQRWKLPYPEAEMKNFAELVACACAHGVTFNYALSPGLDMDFRDPGDVEKLKAKLRGMFNLGVRAFTLALDDIPQASSADERLGRDQADLVNDIYDYLVSLDPDVELFFVPTVYSHTHSYWLGKKKKRAQYLEALARIHPQVGIMWTGPGEVFSREIKKSQAMELKNLWGRPVLIWDNYPVNDINLRSNIFTGPYLGRDPELGEAVGGIFLNPMYLPNASKISLYTAGKYMTDPGYEPWDAYDEALEFLGGDAGFPALKTVSDCLLPHPVFPDLGVERMPVYRAIEDFWASRGSGDQEAAVQELRGIFSAFVSNPDDLSRDLADPRLAQELMPAGEKLALYGQAGLLCLDLASEPDAEHRVAVRREIQDIQARARTSPWKVADETTSLTYMLIGIAPGSRNVLDDFITRSLRELPP